jgi:hypothetical protein
MLCVGTVGGSDTTALAADANPDVFQQSVQRMLDGQRQQTGWDASRCMIPANVTRDVVTGTNDTVLQYGDKITEVADQPLSSSVPSPVIDALRKQPATGLVKLKIARAGSVLTVSEPCSDARPFQMLIDDALASAARADFGSCAEKLRSAGTLHPLNWALAAVLYQCRRRAGKLPVSEPQAIYDVDHQAIAENSPFPENLEKIRVAIATDTATLTRLGASDLAARVRAEFESAQGHAQTDAGAAVQTVAATNQRLPVTSDRARGSTFDFRGLSVGDVATPAAVEQALKDKDLAAVGGVKCGAGLDGQVCNGITVIAGAVAYANVVIDASGRLIRISMSFPSDDFEQVATGAEEKYGKPTKSQSVPVQNRMGATYTNSTLTWGDLRGNYVQIARYGSTLDKGFIYFGTPQDSALLKQAQDDTRRQSGF